MSLNFLFFLFSKSKFSCNFLSFHVVILFFRGNLWNLFIFNKRKNNNNKKKKLEHVEITKKNERFFGWEFSNRKKGQEIRLAETSCLFPPFALMFGCVEIINPKKIRSISYSVAVTPFVTSQAYRKFPFFHNIFQQNQLDFYFVVSKPPG